MPTYNDGLKLSIGPFTYDETTQVIASARGYAVCKVSLPFPVSNRRPGRADNSHRLEREWNAETIRRLPGLLAAFRHLMGHPEVPAEAREQAQAILEQA